MDNNSCNTCEFGTNKCNTMFFYCEIGEMTCGNGICSRHLPKKFINKLIKPIMKLIIRRIK